MSFGAAKRRVEILVPLNYNNGKPVEPAKFLETKREIVDRFGGCTFLSTSLGTWRNPEDNHIMEDINSGFVVIVPDDSESERWLKDYKRVLKKRFRQKEIFMTHYPVGII